MSIFASPFAYLPQYVKDKAIAGGYMYFGESAKDPINYPKSVYIVQEDGSNVEAEQPISIGAGGVPVYNGSPISLDIEGTYSLLIQDANEQQIYYHAVNGTTSLYSETDLRAAAIALGVSLSDIGTVLVTDDEGTSLDDAEYIINTTTLQTYVMDSSIPAGSTVVSLTDNVLVASSGSYTLTATSDVLTNTIADTVENDVGIIAYFHDSGDKDGWLELDGSTYSRTTDVLLYNYADAAGMVMDEATKTASPLTYAAYFGDGDGSTTFSLPNHHLGTFMRGTPTSDALDGAKTHGEYETGQNLAHTHTYNSFSTSGGSAGSAINQGDTTKNTGSSGGAEARPETMNLSVKIHRGFY